MTVKELDRSNPLPLWAQLLADLRARMATGEFEQGFPTDETLTRDYNVSRHTVREAVRRLQADGMLVRQRGRGSTMVRPHLEQPLNGLYSLARTARAQGLSEHSTVLQASVIRASDAAGRLGLASDDDVVFVERLRHVDGEPLSLDRSWLPASRARPILDADLTSGSLYDALTDRCNLRITGGWELIRPVNPPADQRRQLQLPAREAALAVERLAFSGPAPVEWRISTVRGDRYCFRAEWSGTWGA